MKPVVVDLSNVTDITVIEYLKRLDDANIKAILDKVNEKPEPPVNVEPDELNATSYLIIDRILNKLLEIRKKPIAIQKNYLNYVRCEYEENIGNRESFCYGQLENRIRNIQQELQYRERPIEIRPSQIGGLIKGRVTGISYVENQTDAIKQQRMQLEQKLQQAKLYMQLAKKTFSRICELIEDYPSSTNFNYEGFCNAMLDSLESFIKYANMFDKSIEIEFHKGTFKTIFDY